MKKLTLFEDSAAFEFDELGDYTTAVFLIERPNHDFLIDTFCGPDYLTDILNHRRHKNKPLIVINTHYHWDHIWGNSAFCENQIAAHITCPGAILDTWEEQLSYRLFSLGELRMCLPGITFEKQLPFLEDNILLKHSPGHTSDCITLYDLKHRAIYTGDNLERPLIHIEDEDLDVYGQTLKEYLDWEPSHIFSSHTTVLERTDIIAAQAYLQSVKDGIPPTFTDEFAQAVHKKNLQFLKGQPVSSS